MKVGDGTRRLAKEPAELPHADLLFLKSWMNDYRGSWITEGAQESVDRVFIDLVKYAVAQQKDLAAEIEATPSPRKDLNRKLNHLAKALAALDGTTGSILSMMVGHRLMDQGILAAEMCEGEPGGSDEWKSVEVVRSMTAALGQCAVEWADEPASNHSRHHTRAIAFAQVMGKLYWLYTKAEPTSSPGSPFYVLIEGFLHLINYPIVDVATLVADSKTGQSYPELSELQG